MPILRKRVKTNSKIKQQQQQTLCFLNYVSYIFSHSVYQKCSAPNEIEIPDIQLNDLLVTPEQVGILLENVSPSTIAVADGIPPFVLKNCAVTLAPLVHLVFSNILFLRKWPTIWKCSFITPIHKKESKNRVENYRPISIITSIIINIGEILFDFLYSKFHYKLSSRQHGFRKGHSTITQLLVFLDEIYTNYDKNVEQVIIYLDFAKAFDNVDHAILLKKLSLYGPDNDFQPMFSYLTGRKQRVNINGILSDEVTITSGFPQGSVLGPLLFLVYIVDMSSLSETSSCFCFADNTKLSCASSDFFTDCQRDLNKLVDWSSVNSLKFNAEKCVYIHISEAHQCDFKIDQVSLQKVHNTTDLGVEICSILKWSRHIRNKLTKAQRSFNGLRHNVPYSLPNKVKQNLYKSCVLSVLLYAYVAWFPDIGHLRLLEKFYWKGLCWWYGKRNYISALQYSDNIPICYQLIEQHFPFFYFHFVREKLY